jgi:excisionase family DNA binding protein
MRSALSIAQVSRELSVSENTTRRLIKSGRLRASRVRQQWRVLPPDLEAYLLERSNRPRSELLAQKPVKGSVNGEAPSVGVIGTDRNTNDAV